MAVSRRPSCGRSRVVDAPVGLGAHVGDVRAPQRRARARRAPARPPVGSGSARPVGPSALLGREPSAGGERTAVDVHGRAGDELRELGREEQRDAGDVGRLRRTGRAAPTWGSGARPRARPTSSTAPAASRSRRGRSRSRAPRARVLDREAAGEARDRGLERGVDRARRDRAERLDRRDVDDAAAVALLDEHGQDRPRAREDVREVDAVEVVPLVVGLLVERRRAPPKWPTLLTSTSTRPKLSRAAVTNASATPGSRTSQTTPDRTRRRSRPASRARGRRRSRRTPPTRPRRRTARRCRGRSRRRRR